MKKYMVHVYKVSEKWEVPVDAENPEEAMRVASKAAKDPEVQHLYKKESQLFILPFEMIEVKKPKKGITQTQPCIVCYSNLAVEGEEYCDEHMRLKPKGPEEDKPENDDIPPHTD